MNSRIQRAASEKVGPALRAGLNFRNSRHETDGNDNGPQAAPEERPHREGGTTYASLPGRIRRGLSLLLVIFFAAAPIRAAQPEPEELTLFDFWKIYSGAPSALYKGLFADAAGQLHQRKQAVDRLRTKDDWIRRQEQVRRTLMDIVGPFPEKTPLNARVTSVHRKDGYSVENVVYESQPGFYVTASLFLPDRRQEPAPAILYCSGHNLLGYRVPNYQWMILNLVKKGFIVLAFDPIGQGERLQYFDPQTGRSTMSTSTSMGHSYAGMQCFITGSSLARHMIWDGIRSVDYLLTRKEVDPQRLGITGRSGGGTQTAYIAAFDDRLLAAAPECYITDFEHLLMSRGPQDAEQNFYRGIASGIDQADLLAVRAPKPGLIVATTRDIFSFEGTLATYAELKRTYGAFGQESGIRLASDDADHVPTRKNREATYSFFRETLALPGDSRDEAVELLELDELRVTETGMVGTSLGGEDVLSLNRRDTDLRMKTLHRRRENLESHLPRVKSAAASLSAPQAWTVSHRYIYSGRYPREGYFIDKYLIPVDPDYAIPVLVMTPETGARPRAILHLHPDGKAAAAVREGNMERLVKQGYTVISPDVSGVGELAMRFTSGGDRFASHRVYLHQWFGFVLMGRSVVGIQMADVMRTVGLARDRLNISPENIYAIAHGALAPLLLHTSAIEGAFGGVALVEPLVSYRALATTRSYLPGHIPSAVPAALTAYDLPDLAACLAPRKLLMVNVSDPNGAIAGPDVLTQDLAVVRAAYSARASSSGGFTLLQEPDEDSLARAITDWLK